jgi:arginase family enzyme
MLTAIDARISEDTPRDLRGVRTLATALGGAGRTVAGRDGPFARTPWEDDLAASRAVLEQAAAAVRDAREAGAVPVTLATDCALALGTLPAVARDGVRVLWLDAHADYDTPETQTLSFLGCMSLAGACGAWESGLGAIDPAAVVHLGARGRDGDFDFAGQEAMAASAVTMCGVGELERAVEALGDAPVYVHLDPDVLDPAANPIPYGRPGGLTAAALPALLARVAARGPVVGVEITAFHSADDAPTREHVCALLVTAVRAAVAG